MQASYLLTARIRPFAVHEIVNAGFSCFVRDVQHAIGPSMSNFEIAGSAYRVQCPAIMASVYRRQGGHKGCQRL